jgi:hypothetical protein
MREVERDRLAAQRDLGAGAPPQQLTNADIRKLVTSTHDGVKMLAKADDGLKAELYADLGIRLEYRRGRRGSRSAGGRPRVWSRACRRGD